jgi:hypothetical protein
MEDQSGEHGEENIIRASNSIDGVLEEKYLFDLIRSMNVKRFKLHYQSTIIWLVEVRRRV